MEVAFHICIVFLVIFGGNTGLSNIFSFEILFAQFDKKIFETLFKKKGLSFSNLMIFQFFVKQSD